MARSAAVHPWRVVVAWGLNLLASVVAIGACVGRRSPPTAISPASPLAENFSQRDRIDDAIGPVE
jgi:RND superfamily putative drug exporter